MGTVILNERDLALWKRGQHWVMLGANGSGKTFLAERALPATLCRRAGEIFPTYFGKIIWRIPTGVKLTKKKSEPPSVQFRPSGQMMAGGGKPALGDRRQRQNYAMIDFWGRP